MRSDDGVELPSTLIVAGIEREITSHLQEQAEKRSEITVQNLTTVLDNWVVRGVRYDESRRPSVAYFGWVEHNGVQRLMRVAVSMDNQRIATAFADTSATEALHNGDHDYFQRNYEQVEIRDESESAL